MRPDVEQQVNQIGGVIDIESLKVEKADSVSNLIGILEEKLFVKEGGTYKPALHLHEDSSKGIGEAEVARDKRKIELYVEIIEEALDKIDELIGTAEQADAFNTSLADSFPKKLDSPAEIVNKLMQLQALLQSYLDLFKEWENGAGAEALSYDEAAKKITTIEQKLNEVLIGQKDAVRLILTALLTKGHILLESNSGMGKTRLAKSLGNILGLKSARIQCTPDLMATDIVGFTAHDSPENNHDNFKKGPIFANVVLVDEINRTNPKTQSALLEAMEEKQVTNGKSHALPKPFFVIATQNTSGSVGTYPLPEAQLDRFEFIVRMDLPDLDAIGQIIQQTLIGGEDKKHSQLANIKDVIGIQKTIETITVPSNVIDYVSRILINTHPEKSSIESVKKYVAASASIRGEQAILRGAKAHALMENRKSVSIVDVQEFIHSALEHRITLNLEGRAHSDVSVNTIIEDIIQGTAS